MPKKAVTKDIDNLAVETPSQRILLEEFRLLEERYSHYRNHAIERLNFFITAASVAIGGVLVFGSNSSNLPSQYFKIILLITLMLLAIIGLDLYSYLIYRDISTDRTERGLARIREYFISLDPKIRRFFVTKSTDGPTRYLSYTGSGIRRITQVIDGFLLGVIITITLTFTSLIPGLIISIGIVTLLLTFLILELNARRRLRLALKKVKDSLNENDE
jgi:hypothetical protein